MLALLLVVLGPARDRLRQPGGDEDARHRDHQRVGVDGRTPSPSLRPARRILAGIAADLLLLIRLEPDLVDSLRLVRAALDEPDGSQDEEAELEELRLPFLQDRLAEVGREDVSAERDGLAPVRQLLLVESLLSCDGLPEDRYEAEHEEEQRQRVVVQPATHQLCVTPTM